MANMSKYVGKDTRLFIGAPGARIELSLTEWKVAPPAQPQQPKRRRVGRDWRQFYAALRQAEQELLLRDGYTFSGRWLKTSAQIKRPAFDQLLAGLHHASQYP